MFNQVTMDQRAGRPSCLGCSHIHAAGTRRSQPLVSRGRLHHLIPMPMLAESLADLLRTVDRPGSFHASGTAELLPPSLEVEGVGSIALPLLPGQASQLAAAAEPAPFGRGQDTLIDPAVRRCWQVAPSRVRIGGRHWARTLDGIVARAAEGLGVTGPVSAEFYKLLLYGEGGFFVGHRDTEKAPGMFATLVVVLPSPHDGGDLVVRHAGQEARLSLRCTDPAEAAFAAFYADCVHEVLPITQGFRLTLVYNLVRPGGRPPEPPDHRPEQGRAAALLRNWDPDGPVKLVLPLEHAYTPAELGFAALKSADAAVAGVLAAAASHARCDLHLALLTIEENGPAEYTGSYGWRRGGREDEGEDSFEVVEVSNRDVALSDWRGLDGGAPAIGSIPVEEEDELSPPGACDDLAPDEQSFREATGNEGASFERTYRRAALVLWPSGRLPAVLAQAGLSVTLPYLEDLARRWAAAGGDRAAPLRREAHDLGTAMLQGWQNYYPWSARGDGATSTARMLAVLSALGDDVLIRRMLTDVIAAGGHDPRDAAAILDALGRLSPPERAALVEQVVRGTADTAFTACAGLLARAAAAWGPAGLHGAAAALLAAMPGDPAHTAPAPSWQRPAAVVPRTVLDLLAGLGAVDPALAGQAVAHLLAWPGIYGMDAVLVPAARDLPADAPGAGPLRAACVAHLSARAAEPLAPPSDLRRDSTLPCRCPRCTELARFLDDPGRATWVLKAAEADRSHVEGTIRATGSDVDTVTDRRGRPYSLVCTKTQASYERRAMQRKQDVSDLALLAG